jgi:hypothetical protein
VLDAISLRCPNTNGTVSGFGLKSVPCADLELCATSPRSPAFFRSAFTVATLRPVVPLIALRRMLSPIPSSIPM